MATDVATRATAEVHAGHCVDVLAELPAESVHACVTSPPYFRLRQYDVCVPWPEVTYTPLPGLPSVTVPAMEAELGLEDELVAYVGHLVYVFRAVHRVLRSDGTLWLNLGDGWASSGKRGATQRSFNARWHGLEYQPGGKQARSHDHLPLPVVPEGIKRKDLMGVPWRVALALQADGWYLRSELIWHKPNCLPDPTTDRLTRSHETVFQLAKTGTYFHDADAIREPHTMRPQRRPNGHKRRRPGKQLPEHTFSGTARDEPGIDGHPAGRNARSVWTIPTTPFKDAHFAVMPVELAERCVMASTSAAGVCVECGAPWVHSGDDKGRDGPEPWRWRPGCEHQDASRQPALVLDPFAGAGTTGVAALRQGRRFVGIEGSAASAELARTQIDARASQAILFTRDGTVPPGLKGEVDGG